ncbi:MAG: phenylacetate--CoA ligase family protein [Clostridiales bacterium]|nr:phenylacetate--CoA ligase family protein [Clostridiales bacterium]
MDVIKIAIEKVLYPNMERIRGNHIRNYTNELKKHEGYSTIDIETLYSQKLTALLLTCAEHVPAYKGKINKILAITNPMEILKSLPPLTKKNFMSKPDCYLNENIDKKTLIPNRTGGSTSEPVRFFIDRKTVEYYEAARWRGLSWYGISPGSRSVMVWGSPIELGNLKSRIHNIEEQYLKNRIVIPAYSLNADDISQYVKLINRYKPEYLYGYSSALFTLSALMEKQGVKPEIPLKAVVSTSETLFDFQRDKIRNIFSCPVVNEYGARDGGILAYECPNGGLHISAENAILEVVDPVTYKPLKMGEAGLLLVTDLNNFSMPRLRYVLGDMAALCSERCSCNRGMPVLKELSGRVDDMFVSKDGHLIHGHAFNHVARNLTAIAKFQILQLSENKAILKYVLNDQAPKSEVDTFLDSVRNILKGSEIEIHQVSDIPPEKSGKYRYAIRQFELKN